MKKNKRVRNSEFGIRNRFYKLRPPNSALRTGDADLLFEIGTEELPAAYLPSLIEQLRDDANRLFKENHLSFAKIESFGTPRRLALLVHGLGSAQHKPAEEIRGPSKRSAYDEQGKPTQALLGFLRAHQSTIKATKLVSLEKGEYVYLVKEQKTTQTEKVLPLLLPQLANRLSSPKTMRWDESGVRFARPIRWLLAIYGSRALRFTYGKLASGSRTTVGLPLRSRSIKVAYVWDYLAQLKKAGVILSQDERRVFIERSVDRLAKNLGGKMSAEMASHGLLDEVTHLAEIPVTLVGAFDDVYLKLPREVLLASMAKYQRVFAIDSPKGKLLARFIAILDSKPGKVAQVRSIIERILNARLADSLMFWNEDRAQLPLENMAKRLSGVSFHERLGSMDQKSRRLAGLSAPLADAWNLTKEERANLIRSCQLAKADLVSTMVKEFPTLQGVMGKYYALDSNEPQSVARAIEEHYLPIGNFLPQTLIGSALSILDKFDTLSGYFGLGIVPSGDQDPFGLRRAAQGIVEVAWKIHRPLPISQLMQVRFSLEPFSGIPSDRCAAARSQIQKYILERLYTFDWPSPKPSADTIDAVLSSECDDIVDAMERIVSLNRLTDHPGLLKAAKIIERTRNILRGSSFKQAKLDPNMLKEPLEQKLWQLYQSHQRRITELIDAKSYMDATKKFGEIFFEPLHEFFERVLVNAPDEALKQNRLALMKAIHALYTDRIADLSQLAVLQRPMPEALTFGMSGSFTKVDQRSSRNAKNA